MTEAERIKWALLDLLKLLAGFDGGAHHGELERIAGTLGVHLPPVQAAVREPQMNGWKAEQERRMKAPRNRHG